MEFQRSWVKPNPAGCPKFPTNTGCRWGIVAELLEATIKLSAYDYTIFGILKGRVDVISADTFKDERTRSEDGNAHYKVRVRVDMGGLTDKQARIEIRPGMQAQVELHTGEKTVLQNLLKPLYKSREAFREP